MVVFPWISSCSIISDSLLNSSVSAGFTICSPRQTEIISSLLKVSCSSRASANLLSSRRCSCSTLLALALDSYKLFKKKKKVLHGHGNVYV